VKLSPKQQAHALAMIDEGKSQSESGPAVQSTHSTICRLVSERRALQRAVSAKENAFFNSAAFHKASSIIYRFQEKLEASSVHVGLCVTFQII
jgi:hypothetical protein